jgi:uncharacterized membrane protein
MSNASQTSSRARLGFGPWFAGSMAVVVAIVGVAMGPFWGPVAEMAGEARLHLPNLQVWAELSTPVRIHLLTALAALVLGAVLMAVRKGRRFHRVAGWAWVSLVSVTAGATLFIKSLNHGSWSLLHLLTAWTLMILPLAVLAARRHNVARHRRHMMGLFYGGFAINLFIAFIPGRALWVMFFG